MRLINTTTLNLECFPDERGTTYAILSHRWQEEEVLFDDLLNLDRAKSRKGFEKLRRCCDLAKLNNIDYVWIDTCCIDKSSSAELQEAINSMFRWYSKAVVCYAYLCDYSSKNLDAQSSDSVFTTSEWFNRGWTLQELIAPTTVDFFDKNWIRFGNRIELASHISARTGIRKDILCDGYSYDDMPLIVEIMSWAKGRQTTRIEDRAYSMMGLFGVNMAMLYGEGENAFRRLQEEVLRSTEDQSILAWQFSAQSQSLHLAASPDDFSAPCLPPGAEITFDRRDPLLVTNVGISVSLPVLPWAPHVYLALLNVSVRDKKGDSRVLGIFLEDWPFTSNPDHYCRSHDPKYRIFLGGLPLGFRYEFKQVTIVKRLTKAESYKREHTPRLGNLFKFKVKVVHNRRPAQFDVLALDNCRWNDKDSELELIPDIRRCVACISTQKQGSIPRLNIFVGITDAVKPIVMVTVGNRYPGIPNIEGYFYQATSTKSSARWQCDVSEDLRPHSPCMILGINRGMYLYDGYNRDSLFLKASDQLFSHRADMSACTEILYHQDRRIQHLCEVKVQSSRFAEGLGEWNLRIEVLKTFRHQGLEQMFEIPPWMAVVEDDDIIHRGDTSTTSS